MTRDRIWDQKMANALSEALHKSRGYGAMAFYEGLLAKNDSNMTKIAKHLAAILNAGSFISSYEEKHVLQFQLPDISTAEWLYHHHFALESLKVELLGHTNKNILGGQIEISTKVFIPIDESGEWMRRGQTIPVELAANWVDSKRDLWDITKGNILSELYGDAMW